ncbi:MAG: N-acetylmuramoyl-L-alanine amidase family protein [Merdibacter sp.]
MADAFTSTGHGRRSACGLVMVVGYQLLSGVPSSFLLSGALVQTSDVTTIVVDAGHGGYDSGSIRASGVLEKDVTLEVALLVGERLQEASLRSSTQGPATRCRGPATIRPIWRPVWKRRSKRRRTIICWSI